MTLRHHDSTLFEQLCVVTYWHVQAIMTSPLSYVVHGYICDFSHLQTTQLINDLVKCNQVGTNLLLSI